MTIYKVNELPSKIPIGEEAENIALGIGFDYSDWVEAHGSGAIQLLLQRPQDTYPYPVVLTTEENVATWAPTSTDTAFNGFGKAQLVYTTASEIVEKSPVFYTVAGSSLEGAGDPPEPYEDWIDSLTDLASETLLNAQAAAASAEDAEEAKDEVVGELPNITWRLGEPTQIVAETTWEFTYDEEKQLYKHVGDVPSFNWDTEYDNYRLTHVYAITWDGTRTVMPMWGCYEPLFSGGRWDSRGPIFLGNSTLWGTRNPFNVTVPYLISQMYRTTYATEAGPHTFSIERVPVLFGSIYKSVQTYASGGTGSYSSIAGAEAANASGYAATAVGAGASASGAGSTAVGCLVDVSGGYAIGLGAYIRAYENYSLAAGVMAEALAEGAIAMGYGATAKGENSVAIGNTEADSDWQTTLGKFNVLDDQGVYALIIGDGTSNSSRSNLFTIAWDGTVRTNGKAVALLEDIPTDAGEIDFDGTETYAADTVGSELKSIDSTLTSLAADVAGKQDAPSVAGTAGQVLGLDNSLNPVWTTPQSGGDVSDVQVDGSSVVTSGVANIPVASSDAPGVMKINSAYGINISSGGKYPYVASASSTVIKAGTDAYKPVAPVRQHEATYFGLAKAAGVDLANETVTVGTYPAAAKTAIKGMLGVPEDAGDIPYDGTETYPADTVGSEISAVKSALNDKVDWDDAVGYGLYKNSGKLRVYSAPDSACKAGTSSTALITPQNEHSATFYGLAIAAGDSSQSSSSNSVGTYTESAKSAISEMLNGAVSVSGSTPSITAKAGVRYVCGEVATLTVTVPASGIVDVVFTSGSTPTVLTVTPPTGMTMSWAGGFDPDTLEADTTYELNIMDGHLGVAAAWT